MEKELDAYNLDSLRADIMMALCDKTKFSVGSYDIGSPKFAYSMALYDQNYDNIEIGSKNKDKKFVLTGPSITDHYFNNLLELRNLLIWVCFDCISYNIVERSQAEEICDTIINNYQFGE